MDHGDDDCDELLHSQRLQKLESTEHNDRTEMGSGDLRGRKICIGSTPLGQG